MKLAEGESFELYKRHFDLIINHFPNWDPPIMMSEQLLLFFVLRGLPVTPHGPVTHIVLSIDQIGLSKGLRLLRGVG